MTLDTGLFSTDFITNQPGGHTVSGTYAGTLNWGDIIQVLVTQKNPMTQDLSSEWALTASGVSGMPPGSQRVYQRGGRRQWRLDIERHQLASQ